jgi:hypothetical protein
MTTSPGCLNHFRISFTIGVLKTRVNCIPPEKAPIRGGF